MCFECIIRYYYVKFGIIRFIKCNSVFPCTPLQDDKISDWFKLKACADDKINVTENLKFVW